VTHKLQYKPENNQLQAMGTSVFAYTSLWHHLEQMGQGQSQQKKAQQ
jgi:hypothetical protein